ncbi:hypothetical protein D9757_014170 [Collybiopsis confluens]|uniref:Uncharacterized protein n=1 Tax=Collybiopsis confluens TaxID=2823264 RepID=A0A8H5CQW1_9AGAR|nr:hypothetical protein D9757_014170 [Collybiopsis confluens]
MSDLRLPQEFQVIIQLFYEPGSPKANALTPKGKTWHTQCKSDLQVLKFPMPPSNSLVCSVPKSMVQMAWSVHADHVIVKNFGRVFSASTPTPPKIQATLTGLDIYQVGMLKKWTTWGAEGESVEGILRSSKATRDYACLPDNPRPAPFLNPNQIPLGPPLSIRNAPPSPPYFPPPLPSLLPPRPLISPRGGPPTLTPFPPAIPIAPKSSAPYPFSAPTQPPPLHAAHGYTSSFPLPSPAPTHVPTPAPIPLHMDHLLSPPVPHPGSSLLERLKRPLPTAESPPVLPLAKRIKLQDLSDPSSSSSSSVHPEVQSRPSEKDKELSAVNAVLKDKLVKERKSRIEAQREMEVERATAGDLRRDIVTLKVQLKEATRLLNLSRQQQVKDVEEMESLRRENLVLKRERELYAVVPKDRDSGIVRPSMESGTKGEEQQQQSSGQLHEIREELARLRSAVDEERSRRVEMEGIVEDIKRECRAPFIVPALVDALAEISRLTTRAKAMVEDEKEVEEVDLHLSNA